MVTAAYVISTLPVMHSDNCGRRQRSTSLCRLLRPHKRLRETQIGLARLMSIFVRNVRSHLLSKSRSSGVPLTIAGERFTRKPTQHSRRIANGSICNSLSLEACVTPYLKEVYTNEQASTTSPVCRNSNGIHPSKEKPRRPILARSYSTGMESQKFRRQAVSLLDLTNSMPRILSESASELRAANVGSFLIHSSPPVTIRVWELVKKRIRV